MERSANRQAVLTTLNATLAAVDSAGMVVDSRGRIAGINQGALRLFVAAGLETPPEPGSSLVSLMREYPESFPCWLESVRAGGTVALRQGPGPGLDTTQKATPGSEDSQTRLTVRARPLELSVENENYWLLNLYPGASRPGGHDSAVEYVLLRRAAQVPLATWVAECGALSGTANSRTNPADCARSGAMPRTSSLLGSVASYIGARSILLFLREGDGAITLAAAGGADAAARRDLERLATSGGDSLASALSTLGTISEHSQTLSLQPSHLDGSGLGALLPMISGTGGLVRLTGLGGVGTAICVYDDFPALPREGFLREITRLVGCQLGIARHSLNMMNEGAGEENDSGISSLLGQIEKDTALSELAGGMAHELKQPLTALQNFVSNLLDMLEGGRHEKVQQCLDDYRVRISRNVDRITGTIEHLRLFAQKSPMKSRPVNPVEFFDEIRRQNQDLYPADGPVKLGWQVDVKGSRLFVDAPLLSSVFRNLLANAHQAALKSIHPQVGFQARIADDRMIITVTDNGPGIPAEHIRRIFDPFFTIPGTGQGTGLGLSAAQGIVKAHKGDITCRSEDGQGARFVIALPLAESRVVTARQLAAAV
ncbi:MAG: HAMP domain-containing histidine kinase [Deltaproteobacteria bacterium]|nr:HAMP domain-containing histidine kinase [Deltaproteobacteria bacterium]